MKKNLEQNYISVVIVVNSDKKKHALKIQNIDNLLRGYFQNYEIIIVNNSLSSLDFNKLQKLNIKHSIINLPIKCNNQQALNAGIAGSIGDYIIEIEDIDYDVDNEKIIYMYKTCQKKCLDFVFLEPKKIKLSSKFFYFILNRYFKGILNQNITASVMTLSSRRGQNKVSEVGARVINRNLSYILSGLDSISVKSNIVYKNKRKLLANLIYMLDTLIHYTDSIMILFYGISILFLAIFGFSVAYSLIVKIFFNSTEGWSSIISLIGLGFSGVFLLLSVIVRYLHYNLKSSMKSKDYIYKSIDKY